MRSTKVRRLFGDDYRKGRLFKVLRNETKIEQKICFLLSTYLVGGNALLKTMSYTVFFILITSRNVVVKDLLKNSICDLLKVVY